MKTVVIIYNSDQYVIDVDTNLDYFHYALYLRDLIINGLEVEQILKNAHVNNHINISEVDGGYMIEDGYVYFYDYDFDMWECANDYKNHGEDHTDEMLANMSYTEKNDVKYY